MRRSFTIALASSIVLMAGAAAHLLFTPDEKPPIINEKTVSNKALPEAPTNSPVSSVPKTDKIAPASPVQQQPPSEEATEEKDETFQAPLDKNFNKSTSSPNLSDYDYSIKQQKKRELRISPNISVHNQTVEIKLDQEGNQSLNVTTSNQVILKNKF